MNVDIRRRLLTRIIVELVDGKREYGWIAGKDGSGPIAMMHVTIDHQGALNQLVALQPADCRGDVMNSAESLAVIGKGVMETSAAVERNLVFQSQPAGQNRSTGVQPKGADHCLRI